MKTKHFAQALFLTLFVFASLFVASPTLAAGVCGTSVTVTQGDTLNKIAVRCDTTVSALRRANPEVGAGNLIYPGQVLLLPGALIKGTNGYDIYIIARGDTLKSLAQRFGTTMDVLMSLNKDITNANVIYEGQRLTVPAPGNNNPVPQPAPGAGTYTVQKGDTLKKISSWTFTTLDALIKANPQIKDPNKIYIGQVINLPAGVNKYTVQSGDTLKKIAGKFNMTYETLLSLNTDISNPDKIYVGQVIRIK